MSTLYLVSERYSIHDPLEKVTSMGTFELEVAFLRFRTEVKSVSQGLEAALEELSRAGEDYALLKTKVAAALATLREANLASSQAAIEHHTHITPEIANTYISCRTEVALTLDQFESIDPDAARILANGTTILELNGIKTLSENIAQILVSPKWDFSLSLNGLTTLTAGLAKALACLDLKVGWEQLLQSSQHVLELNGVTELSEEAAHWLAEHKGDLHLNGLRVLTERAAQYLGGFHQGDLFLYGLESLSDEAVEHLAKFHDGEVKVGRNLSKHSRDLLRDAIDQIYLAKEWLHDLQGLLRAGRWDGRWPFATLNYPAAYRLAHSPMDLYFDNVTMLDEDVAYSLAHGNSDLLEGPDEAPSVHLDGLSQLSPKVAANLVRGHVHSFSFNGLTALPVELAEALVDHDYEEFQRCIERAMDDACWHISLDGVTDLSAEAAKALATHAYSIEYEVGIGEYQPTFSWSLSLDGLTTLPVEVAEALTGHNSKSDFLWRLSLDGLTSLSVEAARALVRQHYEDGVSICEHLSLDGLTTLTDELAEVLAGHVGELSLMGLTALSNRAAEALRRHEGDVFLKPPFDGKGGDNN